MKARASSACIALASAAAFGAQEKVHTQHSTERAAQH